MIEMLERFADIFRPWNFLGSAKISYHAEDDPNKIVEEYFLHFYGKRKNLSKRKITFILPGDFSDDRKRHAIKTHGYFIKAKTRWEQARENIYTYIQEPSQFFIAWSKTTNGYEYIGRTWVKPAPKVEGVAGIIKFPSTKEEVRE